MPIGILQRRVRHQRTQFLEMATQQLAGVRVGDRDSDCICDGDGDNVGNGSDSVEQ
jgi:hypothetical protein